MHLVQWLLTSGLAWLACVPLAGALMAEEAIADVFKPHVYNCNTLSCRATKVRRCLHGHTWVHGKTAVCTV